jgi:hypothetical protein
MQGYTAELKESGRLSLIRYCRQSETPGTRRSLNFSGIAAVAVAHPHSAVR